METRDIEAIQGYLAWWAQEYPTLAEILVAHLLGRPNGGFSVDIPKAIYNVDAATKARVLAIRGVLGQNGNLSESSGAEKTGDSSDH